MQVLNRLRTFGNMNKLKKEALKVCELRSSSMIATLCFSVYYLCVCTGDRMPRSDQQPPPSNQRPPPPSALYASDRPQPASNETPHTPTNTSSPTLQVIARSLPSNEIQGIREMFNEIPHTPTNTLPHPSGHRPQPAH